MVRPVLIAAVLAALVPAGAAANTPAADAAAHNAAYQQGASIGLSPQTLSEMLTCSAVWDRWAYALASSADPGFAASLHRDLATANAGKRKSYWQREARRQMDEDDDPAYFEATRGEAEAKADTIYAAYVNNDDRGMAVFMQWLGICK